MAKVPNLPGWVGEKTERIYIFVNAEIIMKRIGGVWFEKTVRCKKCGLCCMDKGKNSAFGTNEDGNCKYLSRQTNGEYLCVHPDKPYWCIFNDGDVEGCSIRWEVIE